MAKLERDFQASLIKEIEMRIPGSIAQKMESYIQGWPDVLVLYNDRWALLECKKNRKATHQPNQDDYVELLDKMSFSRFVYPENKEEVLHDLQQAFGVGRQACSTKSE